MVKKKNRNIVIIKDIKELKDEIDYDDFQYKSYFRHLCNLIPNPQKEKIEIEDIENENLKDFGLVYVFVI